MSQDYENNNVPAEYKPIGAWGYFGYELLFKIPIIGFILLLVFSLGGTKNINLRNFARSYFCMLALAIVLGIIFVIIGASVYGSLESAGVIDEFMDALNNSVMYY